MAIKQKTQGVLFAIVEENPSFLILKRSPHEGDYLQPLTGSVEKNETELECLKRELLEEVGIQASNVAISDVIYTFDWSYQNVTYNEFVRGVKIDRSTNIILSEEPSEYKWCDLNEALHLLKHESNKEGFKKVKELHNKQ